MHKGTLGAPMGCWGVGAIRGHQGVKGCQGCI